FRVAVQPGIVLYRSEEPLTLSGVSLLVTKLAKQAGVKLSMKALRKGFGSRYAGRVPVQVLQRLMRHANISTTMDYYANVAQAVEDAVKRNGSHNKTAKESGGVAGSGGATSEPGKGFNRADESL